MIHLTQLISHLVLRSIHIVVCAHGSESLTVAIVATGAGPLNVPPIHPDGKFLYLSLILKGNIP